MTFEITDEQLRRVVARVLREDGGDGGGDFGGDYGGFGDWGGMGGGMGGLHWQGSLYKALVKPFVDVGETALGALENVASKSQAVVETLLQGLPTLVLPFVAGEYDKIKRAESDRASKIKQKYADVLHANSEAFKGDAQGFAFMMAPAHFINHTLIKKGAKPITRGAIEATLRLLDTVTSRMDVVTKRTNAVREYLEVRDSPRPTDEKWDALTTSMATALGLPSKESAAAMFTVKESVTRGALNEDDGAKKKLPSLQKVMSVLFTDDAFQEAIEDSDVLDRMQRDSRAMISSTLLGLIDDAEKYRRLQNLKQLSQMIGKDVTPKGFEQLPDDEKRAIESVAISQVRKGAMSAIKTQMSRELESLKKQGIDEKHPYIIAYKRAIAKIGS